MTAKSMVKRIHQIGNKTGCNKFLFLFMSNLIKPT